MRKNVENVIKMFTAFITARNSDSLQDRPHAVHGQFYDFHAAIKFLDHHHSYERHVSMVELRAESSSRRVLLRLCWTQSDSGNDGGTVWWKDFNLLGFPALIHHHSAFAADSEPKFSLFILCAADSRNLRREFISIMSKSSSIMLRNFSGFFLLHMSQSHLAMGAASRERKIRVKFTRLEVGNSCDLAPNGSDNRSIRLAVGLLRDCAVVVRRGNSVVQRRVGLSRESSANQQD